MGCEDPNAMDCSKARDNLYLFLDHEMDEASWNEIHAHIADCAPCLDEFDVERVVKELVARSCSERAPAPLRERVMTSIHTVQVQVGDTEVTRTQIRETRPD